MDKLIELGKYIRSIRKERDMTIAEVSEASGVSKPYISQVETGTGGLPSLNVLLKLADALQINRDALPSKAGYKEFTTKSEIGISDIESYLIVTPDIIYKDKPLSVEQRQKIIKILDLIME